MIGFTRRAAAASDAQSTDEITADTCEWQINAGDRIGAKPARSRGRWFKRTLMLATIVTGAYALYDDPTRAPRWWDTASGIGAPLLQRLSQSATTTPAASANPASPVLKSPEEMDPPAQRATAEPHLQQQAIFPLDRASAASASAPANAIQPAESSPPHVSRPEASAGFMPEYAPPQESPSTNPFAKRAKAAGLHPDLSPTLLAELSDADYRNAGIATQTALEKTPADATFTWPLRREKGLATFEVRFVTGAAPDCRRYIVTIEKNRWLTTALPVETCAAQRKAMHRAS